MKTSILVAFGCGLVACLTLNCAEKDPPQKVTIRLHNREFAPPEQIDPALTNLLQQPGIFPLNGLVQLHDPPSESQRAMLAKAGVQLRELVDDNVYFAEFSKSADLNIVTKLIRWAGLLQPEDKTEQDLWQGKIEDWARVNAETVRVLVTFYESVSIEQSRMILNKHAKKVYYRELDRDWVIEISLQRVKALAAEVTVEWMEQASADLQPL